MELLFLQLMEIWEFWENDDGASIFSSTSWEEGELFLEFRADLSRTERSIFTLQEVICAHPELDPEPVDLVAEQ